MDKFQVSEEGRFELFCEKIAAVHVIQRQPEKLCFKYFVFLLFKDPLPMCACIWKI